MAKQTKQIEHNSENNQFERIFGYFESSSLDYTSVYVKYTMHIFKSTSGLGIHISRLPDPLKQDLWRFCLSYHRVGWARSNFLYGHAFLDLANAFCNTLNETKICTREFVCVLYSSLASLESCVAHYVRNWRYCTYFEP